METQEIWGGDTTQEICGGRHKRLGVDLGRQRDTAEIGDRGDMGGTQGRFGGGGSIPPSGGAAPASRAPPAPSPLLLLEEPLVPKRPLGWLTMRDSVSSGFSAAFTVFAMLGLQ